jgi:Winged helix DNA-binding domain
VSHTVLSADQVRRRRVAAQLLHRPRRSSPAAVIRHLGGVQAQVLSAAGLALRARSDSVTPAGVDRVRLRDRSIVLAWAMRGTLHLIPAEDHAWLVPLTTEPRIANAKRRLRQEGVGEDAAKRAVGAIGRMLERHGPLRRDEIADRLRPVRVRTGGQAMAHLLWLAAAEGVACHGADVDGEPAFVAPGDWLGPPAANPLDGDAALRELAVRYLRAHAPATPADFAAWSGLRTGDANSAWRAATGRLVEVSTRLGPMWSLRSQRPTTPRGVVRLLPAFDELLLGWKRREVVASPPEWKRINRGGGWLHPTLLADGRLVGTWRTERTGSATTIEVRPFPRRRSPGHHLVELEARTVAPFVGTPTSVSWPRD